MTASDVAAWMMQEVERDGILYQESAVGDIEKRFGEQFVYVNDSGNAAISKDILAEFRKVSGDDIVWERGERCWRKRERQDDPGRQQV